MEALEQARETNRRLNRRLSELEGPWQSKLAKAEASAKDWMEMWIAQGRWARSLTRALGWSLWLNLMLAFLLIGAFGAR